MRRGFLEPDSGAAPQGGRQAKRRPAAVATSGPGPTFEYTVPPGLQSWGEAITIWDKTTCRVAGALRTPLSAFPPGFLENRLQPSNEVLFAQYSMALKPDTEQPRYADLITGGERSRRWLSTEQWWEHLDTDAVLNTVHPGLQNAKTGGNYLTKAAVLARCGPAVRALFLHCPAALSAADVLEVITACPNLVSLGMTEAALTDAGLGQIPALCPKLTTLHMLYCSNFTWDGLASLVDGMKDRLLWIDVQKAHMQRVLHASPPGPALFEALNRCPELRVAVLPSGKHAGLITSCAKLSLLHVPQHAATPLSSLAPLLAARGSLPDIDGFACDEASSPQLRAAANRLHVKRDVMRAGALAQCTSLVELTLLHCCDANDVATYLAPLAPTLRALYISGDPQAQDAPGIAAMAVLKELRTLSLCGMLTNIYNEDDDVPERLAAALLAACRKMPQLWQLDLSGHHEVFYGCIEPDGLEALVRAIPTLRRLDLSNNGSCRKYPWVRVRGGRSGRDGIRGVLNGRSAATLPCTVACGDGIEITVKAQMAGECNAIERRFQRPVDDEDDGIDEEEYGELDDDEGGYDDDD